MIPTGNSLLIIRAAAVGLGTKMLSANVLAKQKPAAYPGNSVTSLRPE